MWRRGCVTVTGPRWWAAANSYSSKVSQSTRGIFSGCHTLQLHESVSSKHFQPKLSGDFLPKDQVKYHEGSSGFCDGHFAPPAVFFLGCQHWIRSLYSCAGSGKKAEVRQQYDSDSEHEDCQEQNQGDDLFYTGIKRMVKRVQGQSESDEKTIEGPFQDEKKWASNVGGETGPGFQTGRLGRLMIKTRSDESVLPILKQWVAEGNPLPKNVVIIAITGLKRDCRYKQALEVADYVWKERLFEMNELDHMYRLYLTGRVGHIEDVEKCFAEIPSEWLTESVYNQLISCYIARDMMAEAKDTLAKLRDSGKLVSALTYNQFISLYRHQRQYDKALEVMEEMNAAGMAPDTKTYNVMLSIKQRQGDVDAVQRLFKEMTAAGVAPDVVTYSTVAKAYMKAGLLHEVEAVAKEMQKHGPKDGRLTQELLLTLYADQGKRDEVEKLWKHIESFSGLSARSYGVMMESLGKLGLIREAEDLAMKAERKKGRLTVRIFNAMMDVYTRHGMMQAAEVLMIRIRKDRLRANAVTYRHLVSGYLKIGEIDKALEVLRTSRESLTFDHSRPWFESFLLILETLAERGEIEKAEHTFQAFTRTGSYRSTVVYNTLLKAYLKARKPAPDLLQRMAVDGLLPDTETLALIKQMESLTGHAYSASSSQQ